MKTQPASQGLLRAPHETSGSTLTPNADVNLLDMLFEKTKRFGKAFRNPQ